MTAILLGLSDGHARSRIGVGSWLLVITEPSGAGGAGRSALTDCGQRDESMPGRRQRTLNLLRFEFIQPRQDREGQLFCLESMPNPAVLCGILHRSDEPKAAARIGLAERGGELSARDEPCL